jgi:hypothetical protein
MSGADPRALADMRSIASSERRTRLPGGRRHLARALGHHIVVGAGRPRTPFATQMSIVGVAGATPTSGRRLATYRILAKPRIQRVEIDLEPFVLFGHPALEQERPSILFLREGVPLRLSECEVKVALGNGYAPSAASSSTHRWRMRNCMTCLRNPLFDEEREFLAMGYQCRNAAWLMSVVPTRATEPLGSARVTPGSSPWPPPPNMPSTLRPTIAETITAAPMP